MITMKAVILWRKEGLSTQESLFVKECIYVLCTFPKFIYFIIARKGSIKR